MKPYIMKQPQFPAQTESPIRRSKCRKNGLAEEEKMSPSLEKERRRVYRKHQQSTYLQIAE